jgi:hypothetical protein
MLGFRILFVSFLLQTLHVGAQQDALLWKVSGNGLKKSSYLFGTYHLKSGDFLKKVKGAQEALEASEAVVGELEITPEVASQLMTYMVMEDQQLDSILTIEQYDSVAAALKEQLGIPIMMLNKVKPMGIYLLLASGEAGKEMRENKKEGDSQPMDMWIQTRAKETNRPVLSLETMQDQAELLFNSSSIERQTEMLLQYIRMEQKSVDAESEKLEKCYSKQNLECLVELMQSSDYSDIEKNLLLRDRNLRWIPQLEENMKKQSSFVAVGALHLAGDQGLISLLQNQGYIVTPVRSKKDVQ